MRAARFDFRSCEWEEGLHPRDDAGKFTEGAGGGGARTHWSEKPVAELHAVPEQQVTSKPQGFWYDVGGDFERWAAAESFQLGSHKYALDLKGENVLRISTLEGLQRFSREYGKQQSWDERDTVSTIDWPEVAKRYDGIEIAPYQWEARLDSKTQWYYGWDAASGVIWRPKGGVIKAARFDFRIGEWRVAYSEDQPRDESGKWTEGAHGGGPDSFAPSGSGPGSVGTQRTSDTIERMGSIDLKSAYTYSSVDALPDSIFQASPDLVPGEWPPEIHGFVQGDGAAAYGEDEIHLALLEAERVDNLLDDENDPEPADAIPAWMETHDGLRWFVTPGRDFDKRQNSEIGIELSKSDSKNQLENARALLEKARSAAPEKEWTVYVDLGATWKGMESMSRRAGLSFHGPIPKALLYLRELAGETVIEKYDFAKARQETAQRQKAAVALDFAAFKIAYREDQARDEGGKWTDEGGGGGVFSAFPVPQYPTSAPYRMLPQPLSKPPHRVSGGEFQAAIQKALAGDRGGYLTPYTAAEYAQMRTYVAHDGTVGAALKDHGDGKVEIVSAFNLNGPKGYVQNTLLPSLIRQGGNYLEAFDGRLPQIYGKLGFVETARYPWDDSMAPKNWDYAKRDHPDFLNMALPLVALPKAATAGSSRGRPPTAKEIAAHQFDEDMLGGEFHDEPKVAYREDQARNERGRFEDEGRGGEHGVHERGSLVSEFGQAEAHEWHPPARERDYVAGTSIEAIPSEWFARESDAERRGFIRGDGATFSSATDIHVHILDKMGVTDPKEGYDRDRMIKAWMLGSAGVRWYMQNPPDGTGKAKSIGLELASASAEPIANARAFLDYARRESDNRHWEIWIDSNASTAGMDSPFSGHAFHGDLAGAHEFLNKLEEIRSEDPDYHSPLRHYPKAAAEGVPRDFYTLVHRNADRAVPAMRHTFLRDVARMRAHVDRPAFERAVRAGNVHGAAEKLMPGPQFMAGHPLEELFRHTAIDTFDETVGQRMARWRVAADPTPAQFDYRNPRAIILARTLGSNLVTNVTEPMRDAIRERVANAIATGVDPEELATELIDRGLGLDARRMQAVQSYHDDLVEEEGYDDAEAEAIAGRYYEQQLRDRALTIARTETMLASDAGQLEAWRQAEEAGLVAVGTHRAWMTTPDEKLCPVCEAMDGIETGIGDTWTLPDGREVATPAEAHPNCRCAQYLVTGALAGEAAVGQEEELIAARLRVAYREDQARDEGGKWTDEGGGGGGGGRNVESAQFKGWFGDSKVTVPGSDKPLVVYHGTTHDIEEFAPAGRDIYNPESDWGAGVYFTSSPEDLAANYASGSGPDLTQQIELRAEEIEQRDEWEGSHEAAQAAAREEIAGPASGGASMPVYLSLETPFVVGDANGTSTAPETHLTTTYDEDTGRESGTLVDFLGALRDEAHPYDNRERAHGQFVDKIADRFDDISASELFKAWKETEQASYLTDDETGKLVGNEVFRRALAAVGFDGVIDRTVNEKFGPRVIRGPYGGATRVTGMGGMDPDTTHFVVFEPTQVKSSIGNIGTFDPTKRSIVARHRRIAYSPDQARDEIGRWTDEGGAGGGGSGEAAPLALPPPDPVRNVGGDQWNQQTAEKLASDYENVKPRLNVIVAQGVTAEKVVPVGNKPTSWDDLTGSGQEDYEQKWKEDHLSQELEWQQQNWQENDLPYDAAHAFAEDEDGKATEEVWNDFIDAYDPEVNSFLSPGEALPFSRAAVEKSVQDYAVKIDDDGKLTVENPSKLPWSDEVRARIEEGVQSGTLPGFTTENIEAQYAALWEQQKEAFERSADKTRETWMDQYSSNADPPDYLDESAHEAIDETWDGMSDKEKFSASEEYFDSDPNNDPAETGALTLPEEWKPFKDGDDYHKTGQIGNYIAEQRYYEILEERGLMNKMGEVPTEASRHYETIDHTVWSAWKGSSTTDAALAFQLASARELGGRIRMTDQQIRQAERSAEDSYPSGMAGLQAYARAKWEAAQYILDKSGDQTVKVYRAVMLEAMDVNELPTTHIPLAKETQGTTAYDKLPTLSLERNGLLSTTTSRKVANEWGGVDIGHMSQPRRVVVRIEAPRTAVIGLPAFGQNIHGEEELVLAGTAWKKWDAWDFNAPAFEHATSPLRLMQKEPTMPRGIIKTGDKVSIDVNQHEAGQAHWLNPEAKYKAKLDARRAEEMKKRAKGKLARTGTPRFDFRIGEWDESLHPRDEAGKWTEGGGGGEGGGGDTSSRGELGSDVGPTVEKGGVVYTSNVEHAARALAEGKKVELNQPREVSTLLSKLAAIVKEAEAKGEKAPSYNLCNVSLKGTNLFCADNKGYTRITMPQLKRTPDPGSRADKELPKDKKGEVDLSNLFREHLTSKGVNVTDTTEKASFLRASQKELVGTQVAGMVEAMKAGKIPPAPIFTSRDNYIIDGHHRWAANIGIDVGDNKLGDVTMPITKIDMGIIEVLDEANKFATSWGLSPKAGRRRLRFDFRRGDWIEFAIPGAIRA